MRGTRRRVPSARSPPGKTVFVDEEADERRRRRYREMFAPGSSVMFSLQRRRVVQSRRYKVHPSLARLDETRVSLPGDDDTATERENLEASR